MEDIDQFFKLKNTYDKQNKIMKSKILHNPTLDLKSKKTEWKSYKTRCVNCKKPVGTYFSMKKKRLIARCGALNTSLKHTPCDLNIDITLDNYKSGHDILSTLSAEQNKHEDMINKKKLDIIYNYEDEDEALNEFDKIKKKYIKNNKYKLSILSKLTDISKPTGDEEGLNNKISSYLNECKTLSKEEGNTDTISAYMVDLKHLYTKLQKTKYKYYFMDNHALIKEEKSIYNSNIQIN